MIGAGFIGADAAAPYRALSPEMVMIRALPVSLSAAPGLGLSAVRAGLRATSGVALLTGTTVVESLTAADGAGRRRHDVEKIAQGIGGRRIIAIACTHAHDDHVNQSPALSKRFNAPVLLHPAEAPLWEMTHADRRPDMELADGNGLCAGGSSCGCCTPPALPRLAVPLRPAAQHRVYRRHPLPGRPGRDGAVAFSFDTTIESSRGRLLTLPGDPTVRTGHGDSTTVGAEALHLDKWIAHRH